MEQHICKAEPVKLRDLGKDESWLQDFIANDPSVIGLGDLVLIQKEKSQPTGGRIDLLLADPEQDMRYEVEIMFGTVDESHIIRTIEYWDIERRRYPSYEHRAVIIAEEITNRFFNVIGLMNRSIPIIAIQMNAFRVDDKACLNFVKVMDVFEAVEDEDGNVEPADRKYWEAKSSPKSMELMDKSISLLPPEVGEARVKYNKHHVALGTTGSNFCWFHLRKGNRLHIHMKPGAEKRDEIIKEFEDHGIECGPHSSNTIRFAIIPKDYEENADLIKKVLFLSEANSRK